MGPLRRDRPAQGPPPTDLTGFPRRRLRGPFYRAARRAPWWHCSGGDCRFDLAAPRGTCSLGTDELVCLLEVLGPEAAHGVVAAARVAGLRIHRWTPAGPLDLADTASRRAAGYGVTGELATMTPYDVPQAWARAFDGHFDGIVTRARFDPGSGRTVAHFGPAGLAARRTGRGRAVGGALVGRLEAECGIRVARPPRLDELDPAPDP